MSNVDNSKTEEVKSPTLTLPALFTVTPKKEVLHQAVVAYLANARQSNAHTKTRGEVSGGGRKPWKQKGTGRARVGSSRSPLWVGGGITFGPRSTDSYSHRLPTKMKRLALSMALSAKVADGKLLIAADLKISEPKTKQVAQLVAKLAPTATSVLFVVPAYDGQFLQAARNLPTSAVVTVNDLNTYDVLNFDTLIMTEASVKKAQELFGKSETVKNESTSAKTAQVEK